MPQTFCPRAWPQLSLGWVFVALSHRQSQSERRTHNHRLSVSSFVFDWIKLPCLVRVLVSVLRSPFPFPLPPSAFLVAISPWPGFCFLSMSQCCALHVGQCTHSFIFMSWQLPVVVSTRTCQHSKSRPVSNPKLLVNGQRQRGSRRGVRRKLKPHALIN